VERGDSVLVAVAVADEDNGREGITLTSKRTGWHVERCPHMSEDDATVELACLNALYRTVLPA
jgi:hypothetical protein